MSVLLPQSVLAMEATTLVGLLAVCGLSIIAIRTWNQSRGRATVPPSKTTTKKASKPAEPIRPLEKFDWQATEPNAFRPFKPIYHITMALTSDTPSDLITIDRDYLSRINLRKSLIKEHDHKVHGCHPAGVDAVQELYQHLFRDNLPVRYPTIFKQVGSSHGQVLQNTITGDEHSLVAPESETAALRAIGTTVEEDVFILKPTDQGQQCVAFMCCFPSGWDPAAKLGMHMKQIHATVPGYEKIGLSVERFFGKLGASESVKRQNWTIQTHTNLYAAKGNHIHGEQEIKEEDINPEETFLRVELQTLSRLPKSHSILFSFKTYLYPIKDLKKEGLGLQLADAVEGLGKGNAPGMWRYKSAARWGRSVCEYLRS